jgi:exopolyphosphatase/guanosine-5'-triphosphate,3'-diphosphate pyrophosphatase
MSLAVKHALNGRYPLTKCDCLLLALGTGSAEICFFRNGVLKSAEILAMGTIRLGEEFGADAVSNNRITEIIDSYAGGSLEKICSLDISPESFLFVATGAGVRTLMDINKKNHGEQIRSISRDKFEKLFLKLCNLSPDEVASDYGIDDISARSVVPAAWIVKHTFDLTNAEALIVPSITTRTAAIEGMIRNIFSEQDQFTPDIISAVHAIGEKYLYDSERTRNITDLSLRIFDKLEHIHGMGARERLYLECAVILHDIGRFVDCRKHHKHSYYLISNTQLPGILDIERSTIAAIARYHRRARPKASHPEYMALPAAKRVIVCKAAAILRVADAIDRSHRRDPGEIKISLKDGCLLVRTRGYTDISLEKSVLEKRVDLFTEVFGLRVVLE